MDEPEVEYTTNEQALAVTRVVAVILLCLGLGIVYWIWPSGMMDLPLGSVTVWGGLRMLGSGALTLFLLYGFVMLWIE